MSPSITCPKCLRTSHHPTDVREGYCGACHDWTSAGGDVETLREWITRPDSDPSDTILIDGRPYSRGSLLDALTLADLVNAKMAEWRTKMEGR